MLLTERQLDVLRFIRDYRRENALAPTLEEIANFFDVSKITVHEHLKHLERKGAIFRLRGKARGIQILYDPDSPEGRGMVPDAVSMPVLGQIAAGQPLEAVEDRETISLQELVPHGPDHYLLKVRGDSMIEDHICDGDYVIVERRTTARNGETVVAVIDDNEATLKRFYREKGRFRLQPANPNYPPIIRYRIQIRGVVVGVVRQVF
ncbi:MAG: repressor LexA [Planctomycetota bacterium]|nr:MAG: repressor LexA [Planctomycetota bacterium]